ncbi:MAG: hypothetical protein R3C28_12055 [Pirellulaceae bacterium]
MDAGHGRNGGHGFCRLSKWWAPVFLLLNIIPWAVPAWATGAGELAIWLFWGAEHHNSQYDTVLAIVGLVTCGVLLTAGPVIYETVERIQFVLVTLVIVLVLGLTLFLVSDRTEAVAEMSRSVVTAGSPEYVPDLDAKMLLGGSGLCRRWRHAEFGTKRLHQGKGIWNGQVHWATDQPSHRKGGSDQ